MFNGQYLKDPISSSRSNGNKYIFLKFMFQISKTVWNVENYFIIDPVGILAPTLAVRVSTLPTLQL